METSYKIIGGDGREYGPATLDELQSWIREGRVAHATHVWRSDLSIWNAAESYLELAADLSRVRRITPAETTGGLDPVGFWPRVGAHLLDQLVLIVLSILIWEYLMGVAPLGTDPSNFDWDAFFRRVGLDSGLSLVYFTLLTGRFGATLGKLAIGVRVVRMDGSPVGYGLAALRFLATILSSFTLCLGYLMVAFREDRRALHDLLAGTQVVYWR